MSLAEETRAAVRERPVLYDALRAGVVNYAAAARALGVSDDTDAVATALRRFEADLPALDESDRDVRVRMHRVTDSAAESSPVAIGDATFAPGDGSYTAVLATGTLDARALERVLGVLRSHDIAVEAAGVTGDSLTVVVARRDGAETVRLVEQCLGE